MKRTRSSSPEIKSDSTKNQANSTTEMSSSCPHLTAAFTQLSPPRPSQQIHKEECTLCFDDQVSLLSFDQILTDYLNHTSLSFSLGYQDGPNGIDVCLFCFNGSCPSTSDRSHSLLHFKKTDHPLVVNVKRKLKPRVSSQLVAFFLKAPTDLSHVLLLRLRMSNSRHLQRS